MKNVSDRICRENQYTHFMLNNFFPRKSCRLWDNVGKYCRTGQATDGNMAHAHCMLDTQGYTHSKHLILVSLPWQKWLRERAWILRYTYTALLFRRDIIPPKCYVTARTEQNTHTHTRIRQIKPLSLHYSPCTTLIASQHLSLHLHTTQHFQPLTSIHIKGVCWRWTSPICAVKRHQNSGLK